MNELIDEFEWVERAVAFTVESSAFQQNCRRRAFQAAAVVRARQSLSESALGAVSVKTFIERVADEEEQDVIEWAGLDFKSPLTEAFARAWGKLASALALSWDRAETALRLSFGEALNRPILIAGVRFRGGTESPEAEWERVGLLAEAEVAGWPDELKRAVEDSLKSLADGYAGA